MTARTSDFRTEEIVIVDDTPASLKLLASILSEAGYCVRPTTDSRLALRSIQARVPSLILLDVRMPDMDGYELCRHIKADPRLAAVPVIFVSVVEEESQKVMGFEAGAVDYINKPFQAAEVLARVNTHLTLSRVQKALEHRNAELLAARATLEDRVRERSRELELSNQHLANTINELKQAEDSSSNMLRFLQTLMDTIPNPIFYKDVKGTYQGCNKAFLKMLGLPRSAVLGRTPHELFSKELADKYKEMDTALFQDLSTQVYEFQVPTDGGERRDVLFNKAPYFDADGQVAGLVGVILDITERKRAENETRAANDLFKSLLRAATAYSIIGTDCEGVLSVFNEGAELLLGYTAAEVLGKLSLLQLHDSAEVAARAAEMSLEPSLEVIVQAARKGLTETREWTYLRKNGTSLTVSVSVTALRNDNGDLTGFIAVGRDVTAEKALERQLLQAQKMESVGLLAGGIAHDFNNLLLPILGYTEMLLDGTPESDWRQEELLQIRLAADRAKELTRKLLAFSRKQIMEPRTLSLGSIVQQSQQMLRRTIRESIAIDVRIDPTQGLVRVDAGQIEQALVNLAVNAQDAMPEGGTLTISVQNVSLRQGSIDQYPGVPPGEYVALAVSDTGVGMDEPLLARVFEPFFTTKDPSKGTGLGLPIVYGIVKQHGGTISVSSRPQQGTTFTLFLPRLGTGARAKDAEDATGATVLRGTETVLLIEDNAVVRTLVCKMLESLGYSVLQASSYDQCLKFATEHPPPHLLLADVVMPGTNGREVYERLRLVLPNLRVLFMSGYSRDVLGKQGVLDEGLHFLQKPFNRSVLSLKLREVLD